MCACSLAESATNAFLQGLDRRVEAAGADLARLESMAFGTVSVEELLGHCQQALNIVSRHADAVESRLVSFGYVAPGESHPACTHPLQAFRREPTGDATLKLCPAVFVLFC